MMAVGLQDSTRIPQAHLTESTSDTLALLGPPVRYREGDSSFSADRSELRELNLFRDSL